MSIQFQCPACAQPIEVDDAWASRPVACPYCRRTIAAPASSTLDTAAPPPMATPLGGPPGVEPLVAEGGTHYPGPPPQPCAAGAGFAGLSNPFATWALAVSGLALGLFVVINLAVASKVSSLVGPGATPEEARRAMLDLQKSMMADMEAGILPSWFIGLAGCLVLMLMLWVAGVVLGILAVRRPVRRRTAVAALVTTGLLPLLICLGSSMSL